MNRTLRRPTVDHLASAALGVLLTAALASAAPPPGPIRFQRAFGERAVFEEAIVVVPAPDDTFWVGGWRSDFWRSSGVVLRIDADGHALQQYDVPSTLPVNLVPAADGGLYVLGNYPTMSTPSITRLDPDGRVIWARLYGDDATEVIRGATATAAGGFVLAGSWNSCTYLLAVDADGNELWNRHDDPSCNPFDAFLAIRATADGGFIATQNGFLTKLDADGHDEWRTSMSAVGRGLDVLADGSFVVAGFTYEGSTTITDGYLAKATAQGEWLWQRDVGLPDLDGLDAVDSFPDGRLLAVGESTRLGRGGGDAMLVETDSDGQVLWRGSAGGSTWDYAHAVRTLADGGALIAGATSSFGALAPAGSHPSLFSDVLVARTDALGESCPGSQCLPSFVALGDELSAGEGLGSYQPGTDTKADRCHRSSLSYAAPRNLKPETMLTNGFDTLLRGSFACSGATTDELRHGGLQRYGEPPQLDRPEVAEGTSLVTLSIGRQDVRLPYLIDTCATRASCPDTQGPGGGAATLRDYAQQQIERVLPPRLDALFADLTTSAPNATVVVLGYPQVFLATPQEQSCAALTGRWSPTEQAFLRDVTARLDDALGAAAARAGFHFVPLADAFAGHEPCGRNGAWVSGWAGAGRPESFQLTKRGQIEAAARTTKYLSGAIERGAPITLIGFPANPPPSLP